MSKLKSIKQLSGIFAVILVMSAVLASCSAKIDKNPPTAPLLAVLSVEKDAVSLAWSESYDDERVKVYKLYRNDEQIAEIGKIEYKDEDVSVGSEYEYYVDHWSHYCSCCL
jgi:anti-sigma-K factor RskA